MLVDYYRTRFLNYVNGRKSNSEKDFEECRKEFELLKNKKGKVIRQNGFTDLLQIYQTTTIYNSQEEKVKIIHYNLTGILSEK